MKENKITHSVNWQKIMRISLIQFIALFLIVNFSYAHTTNAQTILDKEVTVKVENVSLKEAIQNIQWQTQVKFVYSSRIKMTEKVSIRAEKTKLSAVLDKLLTPSRISYKVINEQIVLMAEKGEAKNSDETPRSSMIQTDQLPAFIITGQVTDEKGEPLVGASVVLEGTQKGTLTDENGTYKLELDDADKKSNLVFSFVGYDKQIISLNGQSILNIILKEAGVLNEIVVVGYGTLQKKLLTGATSQVKGSEIQQRNTTGTLDALKGQVAGLNITKTSAQPGDGFKVSIRGIGTTGNANPLYVLDGVPVTDISFINPSDIESLDVLKDAASAAIYGSRASNGVVLITTKKGKSGKTTVTYDGFFGVQNVAKKLDYVNANDYLMLMTEHFTNNKIAVPNYSTLIPNYANIANGSWAGTNWLEATSNKNAPIQNHSVNISGGTDQAIYSMGVSLNSEEGIVGKPATPTYDRVGFRMNSEFTLIKNNNLNVLKIGENLNYSHTNRHVTVSEGAGNETSIASVAAGSPVIEIYNPDPTKQGIYPYFPYNIYGSPTGVAPTAPNPLAWLDYEKSGSRSRNNNLYGNIYLTFEPIKKLTFRSSFGVNAFSGSDRSYVPAYQLSATTTTTYFVNPLDRTSQSMQTGLKWIFDNTLSYNFSINNNHNVDVMVGGSAEKSGIGEFLSGTNSRSLFNDYDFAYLTNNKTIDPSFTALTGAPLTASRILSTFGRFTYDYKQTYILTGVFRYDGSSNFAPANRWGFFPSISAGWAVTNEPFMKNATRWIDFLKIRGSWGENGNQSISPFQYLSTIGFTNAQFFRYADKTKFDIGGYPNILPNPNVSWETSAQTDIGFDARFLKDRLGINFDWYNKLTKDWLIQAPILATDGTSAPFINGGDVQNKGFEIAASWNDRIGDFKFGITATFANQQNKVTRIANPEGIIHGPNAALHADQKETYRAQVGQPIGYFWGLQTNGLFQNAEEVANYKNSSGKVIQPAALPGDLRYVDRNDDGVIDQADNTNLGDPNPNQIFGLSFNCSFKGFDFSALANGVTGNQIMWNYFNNNNHGTYNWSVLELQRWHGEGTSNTYPRIRIGSTQDINLSSLNISDASFLRISNLILGYDLKRVLKDIKFQNLRLYVSCQNLYTFTKYEGFNPEVGNGGKNGGNWAGGVDSAPYPLARTYLLGISTKF